MKYETTWKTICFMGSTLFLIVGILALFSPLLVMKFLSGIMGVTALLVGLAILYQGLAQIDVLIIGATKICVGLINCLIGVKFLISKDMPYKIFALSFGIWSLVSGILKLNMYMSLRRDGDNLKSLFLKGVVNVLFGTIIIIFPITTATLWIQVIGLYVIFLGLDLLVSTIKNQDGFL